MKNLLTFLMCIFLLSNIGYSCECEKNKINKPNFLKQAKFDATINERLSLTKEQHDQLKANRAQFRKEMSEIIEQMETLHIKIRNVYYSGIPKFQADLKTAPMKAELVTLKQKADKLKQEHRKNFQNVLTEEQKIEFQKFKEEKKQKKIN